MSFSIADAAREAPDRIGLVAGGRRYTFAELAERAAEAEIPATAAHPFAAPRDAGSATLLYALLDRQIAAAPLSPRLPTDQQRQLAARVARFAATAAEPAATVLFTSGTRGRPRGVVHDRAALAAAADASAEHLGWHDEDRWLCPLPLAHAGGLSILLRCLRARRTAVLADERPFDAAGLRAILQRETITLLSLVPTMLASLIDTGPPPAPLRAILVGGAGTPAPVLERAVELGWPVLPTYGMTETFGQVCTAGRGRRPRPGDVGPPLPGWEVIAPGGAIHVRGPALLRRYLDAPDPLDADGWLVTGDRGHLDRRGHLRVVGRADDTIVTGGENVHPSEVEDRLLGCPGIEAACVFGVPDPHYGQAVAAAIVGSAPVDEVAAFARAHLAPHQRPRRLCVVDALPLGPTGKVDRRAAAKQLAPGLGPA